MKYLKFKNQGEITAEAISLLGASTKRSDKNKIGYFGSGNKFALAYLIRNGYKVKIYGGLKELEITTVSKKLGEQPFDVICINGQMTSITTDFGAKWELWQALRELYSNALDEGEGTIEIVNEINVKEEETHYYIEIKPEINLWFGGFDDYFSENKKILHENKYGRILSKHNDTSQIYRKGISVMRSNKNSLYDYDFNSLDITEDRIVKYTWEVPQKIWAIIYSCNDKTIIKNILHNCAKENMLESNISEFTDIDSSEITEEFKEVLREMQFCSKNMTGYLEKDEVAKTTVLPSKVFNSLRAHLGDNNVGKKFRQARNGDFYKIVGMQDIYQASLNKVFEFLKEANYTEPLNYEITAGIFENKKVMGFADRENDCIVISDIGFEKGTNYILETIIEEFIHLKYGADDETRLFQDSMIIEMVKILKIRNAYIL